MPGHGGRPMLPPGRAGCYRYYLNGEDSGITETWSIGGDAARQSVECLRLADSPQLRLEVRATVDTDGVIDADLTLDIERNGALTNSYAEYRRDSSGVSAHVCCSGERVHSRFEPGLVFSPLMRIFNGPVISRVIAAGGSSAVLVPSLYLQPDSPPLLSPLVSERRVSRRQEDRLQLGAREQAATVYEYCGGEYQPGTRFWIDTENVMLQYHWRQDSGRNWEVRLQS